MIKFFRDLNFCYTALFTEFLAIIILAVEVQRLVLMICGRPLQDMMSLAGQLLEAIAV
jgi:hypothetical protein